MFDQATSYSHSWCLEVEEYAKTKGYDCIILNIADAIKENVEQALNDNPTAILVHYDHGNEDCIWGNDDRHVVDLTNNSLLRSRVAYNMNCLSAKKLGVDSYWRYSTTYWGSWEVISFTTDALNEFEDAMNYGIKLRLDGETDWNVIMDKTKEHDDKIIDELIAKGKVFAAALLAEDSDARRVWTDKTPPPSQDSNCKYRKILLRIFGPKAWRIPNPVGPSSAGTTNL